MERKVKGTLVKMIVKGIRADQVNKATYDNVLSDEAKELVNMRILDSIWYSFDAYNECYTAIYNFLIKKNYKIVIQWGNEFGESIMNSAYKNLLLEKDIDYLLEKYQRFHKLVLNFGTLKMERVSNNEVLVSYLNFNVNGEVWFYTSVGWMQKSLEMCLNKKVNYEFLKKSWEGDDITQYKLSWIP
ncbi:MAG: hypothetical protein JW891_05945 [Candidatus Lokiarchaeota archaeon]|nr:hypothetical protein [Candidatus Lokiarchaeota archaeon]